MLTSEMRRAACLLLIVAGPAPAQFADTRALVAIARRPPPPVDGSIATLADRLRLAPAAKRALDARAARLAAAIGRTAADPTARLDYRLPAAGRIVTRFGTISETGARARGLTLATAPGARVTAPAAGRVTFAGRYRGYGSVVILDHGDGLTSTVTGLAATRVAAGRAVSQGDVLGAAPPREPRVTVELTRQGVPIDIAPLIGRPL